MLTIDHLSLRYGRAPALTDLTATAGGGRIVALVGRNGSGKSTLLRVAAGLLAPSAGTVRWNALDVRALPAVQRARCVAYVSQRPLLSIALSVFDAVALGQYSIGRQGKSLAVVEAAIAQLGLEELAHRSFHELSAGEQQRALVARALVQHQVNGLLALDEPFSNLDPGEATRVAKVLRLRARAGALVLVATHDLTLADQIADEVWWLEKGAIIAAGAPAEVLTVDRLRSVFNCDFVRGAHGISLCTRAVQ